jgi:protein-tyrosine kinase
MSGDRNNGNDKGMSDLTPGKPKRSLLERANERFDFNGQLRRIEPGQIGGGDVVDAQPRVRATAPGRKSARVAAEPAACAAAETPATQAASIAPAAETAAPETPSPAPAATPAPAPRMRAPVPHRRLVPSAPRQAIDRQHLADNGLIDPDSNAGALAEELRIVKRQLLRTGAGLPHGRRILVTSSQPDEGKTFSVLNLALSLAAEQDLSVVLIDGDFARSDVTRQLGLTAGPGLTDALLDPSIDLATCIIPTDLPRLAVLPSGAQTVRDTELLSSTRMADLLDKIEADAPERIILFDSMPLLAASSPGVLAQHCGQVLVVVRADVTREAALRDAIGLIGQHGSISLLLNRVRFTPEGRRFGSYYGEGG